MTVQFNLLPDIKVQFLKARRQEHLVTLVAIVAGLVALLVFIVLVSLVYVVQKRDISSLNNSITSKSTTLRNTPDINSILTIQSQLEALPSLHDKKVVSSRLFTYLSQVTPTAVTIASLHADFTANTVTISGNATSLAAVNTYIDTLKSTTYTTASQSTATAAFSQVVLASFSEDAASATYSISLDFDPAIFSETQTVTLSVPNNTIPTRLVLSGQAAPLFQGSAGGQ